MALACLQIRCRFLPRTTFPLMSLRAHDRNDEEGETMQDNIRELEWTWTAPRATGREYGRWRLGCNDRWTMRALVLRGGVSIARGTASRTCTTRSIRTLKPAQRSHQRHGLARADVVQAGLPSSGRAGSHGHELPLLAHDAAAILRRADGATRLRSFRRSLDGRRRNRRRLARRLLESGRVLAKRSAVGLRPPRHVPLPRRQQIAQSSEPIGAGVSPWCRKPACRRP